MTLKGCRLAQYQDIQSKTVTLGDPDNFDSFHIIDYSRFNTTVQIERDNIGFAVKFFLPILLIADAEATHQSVVTAMDGIGQSGFTRLNIATQRPQQSEQLEQSGSTPTDLL